MKTRKTVRRGSAGRALAVLFATLVLATPGTPSGAVTVFDDEDVFRNAHPGLSFESFETLKASNSFILETLVLDDFTMTAVSPDSPPVVPVSLTTFDQPSFGRFATHGAQYVSWRGGYDGPEGVLVIDFLGAPIRAFGFTLTDPLDFVVDASIALVTDAGDALTVARGERPDGSVEFFGFTTETPFTRIVMSDTQGTDTVGIDGLYFGVPIPAPATLSLCVAALALAFVGIAGRRPDGR